ncbi:hypothetical protein GCM10010191_27150 [Actinomadura vinacea]|uniref:LPXTG cell wall anchor domain-containing protein n=1 Tax=Actinomadura vinacea TaxID=115336 RepID=A0ABP5VZ22_9ACTN
MTFRRLAAVGAAGAIGLGALALTAGPAYAAPELTVTPEAFKPGDSLTLKVTECEEAPKPEGANTLFAATPIWVGGASEGWKSTTATKKNLTPGTKYTAKFTCPFDGGTSNLTVSTTPQKDDDKPPVPPKFDFGYDDVKLSTRRVVPGGKTTFTVTCPAAVSITSNGYTKNPLPVKKTGKNTWTATGTLKSSLPDPTLATVTCKGHGSVKYSTSPEKGDLTPKKPSGKIPSGRIDTGDGSTVTGGDGSAVLLAGGGAVLAAAGLGIASLRRRTGQERS